MKSTRKARSSRRKTLRQKGGKQACPYSTPTEQLIRNIWNSTIRILKNFDANYRGEFHVFKKSGACNLWVWKKGETSKDYENHMDIYWYNFDSWMLGITATKDGKHVGGNRTFDLSYAQGYSQEELATEIAGKVDGVYNEIFY
jgi:hypothetical protein